MPVTCLLIYFLQNSSRFNSFMVVIETISNDIRPGTLAVRLAANTIAGHLSLTLLGGTRGSEPCVTFFFFF